MQGVTLTCPHCSGLMEVNLAVITLNGATGVRPGLAPLYDADGRVNIAAKRAVRAMLVQIGPGRRGVRELFDYYNEYFVVDNAPRLSMNNFVAVLKMLDCKPFRSTNTRGYDVPLIEDPPAAATDLDIAPAVEVAHISPEERAGMAKITSFASSRDFQARLEDAMIEP